RGGRRDHRRPRRDLAVRLREAPRQPSRGDPPGNRSARLDLYHPPHRSIRERAAVATAWTNGGRSERHRHSSRACVAALCEAGRIGGLPLAFAQPLVLLGLLALPALWWLLRLIPPRPRQIAFPPTRLLFDIAPREETPARTPWWLTALRLALAA